MYLKFMLGFIFSSWILLLSGCDGASSAAKQSPSSVKLQAVIEGLDRPVFITPVMDQSGRLLVLEKSGVVQLVSADYKHLGEFLNIESQVTDSGEQGLLGLAFDPNVENNGYFYVYYSSTNNSVCQQSLNLCSIISRFSLASGTAGFDFGRANPHSETQVLEVAQPATNHNGGMLAFGGDGLLYIGLGDGGGSGDQFKNAQNLETLLGALLRIDVQQLPYSIPPDNPFANAASPIKKEIWAFGLRNPWRFSFDSLDDTLWLADVGQGDWEEIDIIRGGGNYGWSVREGGHTFNENVMQASDTLLDPKFEYGHDAGISITGGYVYRGELLSELQGFYIYGDFSGPVWALNPDTLENHLIARAASVASFGQDEEGELFVVDLAGVIYKILPGNDIMGDLVNE